MKNLLIGLLSLISFLANAQQTITGTVHSRSGEPMIGANVYLPTTYEGGMVDSTGKFQFRTSAVGTVTLMVQNIGYATDSIKLNLPTEEKIHFRLRPTISNLSQVVITAGAMEASDTRKTAVLSSIDVVTTGATGDLVEAMGVLPGAMQEGETGQLLVRGGAAAETQAFINGLRVPQLYTANIPDVPSRTRFSPFDFKGITFATGGFSAEYGDAMSAALILQTQNMPEEDKWSLGLMSLGASVGYTKLFDKQAVSFSGNMTHLGLYKNLNKDAKSRLIKSPQGGEFQLGYWLENKRDGVFRVYGKTSYNTYLGKDSTSVYYYGGEKLGIQNNNTYAQAVYQEPMGKHGFWEAGISQNHDRTDFRIDDIHKYLIQFNTQARFKLTGQFKEIFKWKAGWIGERSYEKLDVLIDEKINFGKENRWSSAIYGEVDWFLNKDWLIRAGLRGDYYSSQDISINPRLQISRIFSNNHQLVLSGGRYRQRLIPQEFFAESFDQKSSFADHLMLTYFKNWNKRILRIEAYYKKYQDLTLLENGMTSNAGAGHAQGFDVFLRDRKTFRNSDLWVSFSWIDSHRKWLNITEKSPASFASPQVLSLVYKRYFPKPQLGISLTYRWHSGRPYQDPNKSGFNQQRAPHFHDLSANLSYLTNIKDNFTVIFISMTNVPNFNQIHSYRYRQNPNPDGVFERQAIRNLFPRFPFVGMFVDIGNKEEEIGVEDL